MAAAGTITKLSASTLDAIAREPSYFQFDVSEGGKVMRLKFPTYDQATAAKFNAVTCGFEVSEMIPVHKLEA